METLAQSINDVIAHCVPAVFAALRDVQVWVLLAVLVLALGALIYVVMGIFVREMLEFRS